MQNQPLDQSGQRPPKSWLVESILATLFCCLPLGIVGIINATKVESRFFAGDVAGAEQASADAKRWTMISFWIGLVVIVLYVVFVMIMGATALTNSNSGF